MKQRLKAKVGLNKKPPPTPVPAVAHSAAPAEVERAVGGQGAVNAGCVTVVPGARGCDDYGL